MPGYLPAKESNLITWLQNFSTLITASPATYGLIAADAVAISAVNTPYQAAYLVAKNPTTRSPTTVATKNTDRVNCLAVVRPYSQQIANNAGVSPANKVALGLNPRTSTPTPVPAPTTVPDLTLPNAIPNSVVLRYRDSLASPTVKSKPPGAIAADVYITTTSGVPPVTLPASWTHYGSVTKSPSLINTTSLTKGMTLWVAARWVTRKGLVGTFGTPASIVIV